MSHTRRTLLLNEYWDISVNSAGNLPLAGGDYSTAQNVANECRLFTDDAYYAKNKGIPYFNIALGLEPAESVLRARLRKQALNVADVASVNSIEIEEFDIEARTLRGSINVTSKESGENVTIEL